MFKLGLFLLRVGFFLLAVVFFLVFVSVDLFTGGSASSVETIAGWCFAIGAAMMLTGWLFTVVDRSRNKSVR